MNYQFDEFNEKRELAALRAQIDKVGSLILERNPRLCHLPGLIAPNNKLPMYLHVCPTHLPTPVSTYFSLSDVIDRELSFYGQLEVAKLRVREQWLAEPPCDPWLNALSLHYAGVEHAFKSGVALYDQRRAGMNTAQVESFAMCYPDAFVAEDLRKIFTSGMAPARKRLLFWRFIEHTTTPYLVFSLDKIIEKAGWDLPTFAIAA